MTDDEFTDPEDSNTEVPDSGWVSEDRSEPMTRDIAGEISVPESEQHRVPYTVDSDGTGRLHSMVSENRVVRIGVSVLVVLCVVGVVSGSFLGVLSHVSVGGGSVTPTGPSGAASPNTSTTPVSEMSPGTVVGVVNQTAIRVSSVGSTATRTVVLSQVHIPDQAQIHPSQYGVRNTSANRSCIADWGQQTRTYLETQVNGSGVVVFRNSSLLGSSRKGGAADVQVYDSTSSVSLQLVRAGYGIPSASVRSVGRYQDAVRNASQAGRGVWGCPSNRPSKQSA